MANGTLRVQFDSEQRFELFEFLTHSHEEYISRRLVIQAARPAHNWVKEWHNLNHDNKQSPEMSKKSKARPAKAPPGPPPDLELPHSVVKSGMGITEAVYQFLEVPSFYIIPVAQHGPDSVTDCRDHGPDESALYLLSHAPRTDALRRT